MPQSLQPVRTENLHTACARRMEAKILSGEWQPGQKLRPERKLAEELQVSRPVVHQALVELASKGFVRIVPRKGVHVCDYRTTGSLSMLSALLSHHDRDLDPEFVHDMIEARKPIETETARLAAERRTMEQIHDLEAILEQEIAADDEDCSKHTELDFQFHLTLALASSNRIYPMILNSFKRVYTRMTGLFFASYAGRQPVQRVFEFHSRILEAVRQGDADSSAQKMSEMLDEGARCLIEIGGQDHD